MQFRTRIDIKPFEQKIDHRSRILSLGSCFATSVAERLKRAKFDVTSSPTGILFNPESIAAAIERFDAVSRSDRGSLPSAEDLCYGNGRYFSYDFHSDLSHPDANQALTQMREAVETGAKAVTEADTIIITFGTAFVYRLRQNGEVVANCHKQPQANFVKELLSAEEIATRYKALIDGPLANKQIIFTLSPVRHLGDGLEQNSLSKSTARVAIDLIVRSCQNAHYFPSYEILVDELRDYRFYADDMAHPARVAIDYIWQRFGEATFGSDTHALHEKIEESVRAAEHRPFNSQSEEHRNFCRRMMAEIEALERQHPQLKFEQEKATFGAYL